MQITSCYFHQNDIFYVNHISFGRSNGAVFVVRVKKNRESVEDRVKRSKWDRLNKQIQRIDLTPKNRKK